MAGKVVRKSYLRPHAARGYRVKLQRQGYTERRTPDIAIEQTSVGLAHARPNKVLYSLSWRVLITTSYTGVYTLHEQVYGMNHLNTLISFNRESMADINC